MKAERVRLVRLTPEGKEATKAARAKYNAKPEAKAKKYLQLNRVYTKEARARINANGCAWARNNPEKANANSAKRRAAKLNRTPAWSETVEIEKFYANCHKGTHVDHIIPLQGKLVSGLHCLANLQYLTAEENKIKKNNFDPTNFVGP